SVKIFEGGYVPVLLAAAVYTIMWIWHRGSAAVAHRLNQAPLLPADFLADLKKRQVPRVPGTAVFPTRASTGVPPGMVWHLRPNRALHERVLGLTALPASIPPVAPPERPPAP